MRTLRVYLTSFLLLSIADLSACSLYPGGNSGSPPDLAVVQANDLGTFGTNPKILGRDGGYSGVFAGFAVWIYGDTFLANPNAQGQTLISDSWAFTADLNATDGITGFQEREDSSGAPTMLLQLTAAEQTFNAAHQGSSCEQPCGARWALWPGPVVADPARNRALVFYQLVMAGNGNFNFAAVGYSVAIWQSYSSQPQRPTINPNTEHPDLLFGQNAPDFGSAAFADGDTLYAYACNGSNPGAPCVVGRVALESVLEVSAWTFYAGNGNWSGNVGDAVSVMNAAPIMNVSWNAYLQCYVAVYNAPFSQDVKMRTSPRPEGPWSRDVTAFEALTPTNGGNSVHDALAHPEFN